jgi:hypothetical protein
LHFDEVHPDTRVLCHVHNGPFAGTVLYKSSQGFGDGRPVVLIAYDRGGWGYRWAEQLMPLPGPITMPKLYSHQARIAHFYHRGQEYRVWNTATRPPARWQVAPDPPSPGRPRGLHFGRDYTVRDAPTRHAALTTALDRLTAIPPTSTHSNHPTTHGQATASCPPGQTGVTRSPRPRT